MRGLVVPDASEDFTADPVELFFDLAFVFAFSQLVGLLIESPTWDTIGRATLIFLMLWLPWTQFAWSANAVPGNSRTVRVLFLVATAASVPMAASVQTAFDQSGVLFAIPLAVIFLMAIALMVVGIPNDSQVYRSTITYATPTLAAMTAIVVGGFLDGDARVVAWIIGVLIVIYSTIKAGGNEWIIRAGHFAERHALILIVALGEVIVAIGNSVVVPLDKEGGLPTPSIVALVGGRSLRRAALVVVLRSGPARLRTSDGGGTSGRARQVRPRRVHLCARADRRRRHSLGSRDGGDGAPPERPAAGSVPGDGCRRLLLYFGGVGIGVYRSFAAVAHERFVAVALMIVLMLVGDDVDGVVLLVGINVILLATLIVEHLRIEGTPSRPGDATVHDASARRHDDGRVDGEAAH